MNFSNLAGLSASSESFWSYSFSSLTSLFQEYSVLMHPMNTLKCYFIRQRLLSLLSLSKCSSLIHLVMSIFTGQSSLTSSESLMLKFTLDFSLYSNVFPFVIFRIISILPSVLFTVFQMQICLILEMAPRTLLAFLFSYSPLISIETSSSFFISRYFLTLW